MAYLLGIKQQSLNELLKKLEKNGYVERILCSLEEMVGNPLDQEAYEWMERIQSHMGREQFEKVVEEHGFGGMPFIRRNGFEHFSHDFRGTAPEDLPGAERFSPDYDGPIPGRT